MYHQPMSRTISFRLTIYVGGIRACKFTHTVQVSLIYLKHQLNAGCRLTLSLKTFKSQGRVRLLPSQYHHIPLKLKMCPSRYPNNSISQISADHSLGLSSLTFSQKQAQRRTGIYARTISFTRIRQSPGRTASDARLLVVMIFSTVV